APMCGNLTASGYPVTLFNRTRERARSLLERGAAWAESPQAVAQHADVVFTMVGFPDDVREIVLGPAGTLAGAGHGTILVDMTTQRAVAGAGDLRGGPRAGRGEPRRPRVGWRRRRARGGPLDHGGRRPGRLRARRPAAPLPGRHHRPPGPRGGGAAHQDGEPDPRS